MGGKEKMIGVKCPMCSGRMVTTKLPYQRAGTKIQKAVMKCDSCNHRAVFK